MNVGDTGLANLGEALKRTPFLKNLNLDFGM